MNFKKLFAASLAAAMLVGCGSSSSAAPEASTDGGTASSGASDVIELELLFEDSEASKAVAENLQQMFETNCPGLKVTLNSVPKKTRLDMMKSQQYELGLTRWGPDYADPQTYMDLFLSTNVANNQGRYNSAQYDELVLKGTTGADATDSAARWADFVEAERIMVAEDYAVIPIYQNGGAMMINPDVSNINFHSACVDDYRHIYKNGGDEVVVQFDADLSTMDHHIATDGNSFIMQSMCYSGLTSLDADGAPVPELATSWDISDDGLVYTFHLAEGATWSNGTPVTANDFVYGWRRLDDPELASEYAFILDTIHVVNAAEVNEGSVPAEELGVKAIDDKTFEVTLTLPCDFLLGLMAFPSFFPLNQEYFESQGDQFSLSPDNMIFCGPYNMTERQDGNSYTFTKRADYFNQDDKAVESVVFRLQQDTQSALLEYQSGNFDVVKLQGEQVDLYKDEPGFTNRLTGYLWYLPINFTVDKLQNLNLRKALAYAIDREAIAKDVLKDGSIAADGEIPVDLATGPDGKDFRETAGKLTEYDPAKAAEFYAAAVKELSGN